MSKEQNAGAAARAFNVDGEFVSAHPYGSGHINDSFCAQFERAGVPSRILLQRINTRIFRNPVALMENIERVTDHLAAQVAGRPGRCVLTLIHARDGRPWHQDEDGDYWRAYRFIEGARTFDAVESEAQAFQAARAFGEFQRLLASLPPPRLHDTIEDFHHTPKRFAALERAIEANTAQRAASAIPEIAFALSRKSMAGILLDANLPERVTHNDTKLNNVMFDEVTGESICVVDLETVMPGLAAYDFGDMVRTTTSGAEEDERELSKAEMQFPLFEALLRGYLSTAGEFLTKAEKQSLAGAGKLITFEQGIRFLTDYLAGDVYFKVHRAAHNLDRCRAQFKLVRSMERQEERMERLVNSIEA